jgi:hypothetical protein
LVPDGTYWNWKAGPILGTGPEDEPKQTPVNGDIRVQGSSLTAHFLVIAAPRPSGLRDLESIQASETGGRFFDPMAHLALRGLTQARHY